MTLADALFGAPVEVIAAGFEATARALATATLADATAALAVLLVPAIAYELHDERFDDDRERSLIESRPLLVVLLVVDLAVIAWWWL